MAGLWRACIIGALILAVAAGCSDTRTVSRDELATIVEDACALSAGTYLIPAATAENISEVEGDVSDTCHDTWVLVLRELGESRVVIPGEG